MLCHLVSRELLDSVWPNFVQNILKTEVSKLRQNQSERAVKLSAATIEFQHPLELVEAYIKQF
jgi:hypothetical protein